MQVTSETFAVDALAAARLTRLLHQDKIGAPARATIIRLAYRGRLADPWKQLGDDPEVWAALDPRPPFWAEMLRCRWCVSVWAGGLVAALRWAVPAVWSPVARALAASQIAGMAGAVDDRMAADR